LIALQNKYRWNLCIKKSIKEMTLSKKLGHKKVSHAMWGLYAMEDIMPGAFVVEYVGEVVTKKAGDIRGTHYDKLG
jgi:hypothetical protein